MQEKIAFLLKPIKILMDKFYLRGKFSTIIIVILIGYLPAAYYIYTTLKSSLDMLNSEITGTNYLSSIQNAYYQTVLTATSNPTIDRARQLASIKKDIDELIHLKKNVSDQLKLSAQLQELSDELSKGDNTDRYYFNLLSRFQALLSSVINNSQLILDPSPNTFPLIDGILNQMPLLLSEYKQYQNIQSTNNQPTQIPAINEQHPKLAIQQAILASRIAERINTIKSDLNNTSLLNKNLQSYVANTSALLRSITAKIVDAAQGSQKSEVSPMLIESINKNLIEGQELIRGQLEQRKNNLETQSLLIFITVGLAVILMIYCVLGVIVAIKVSTAELIDPSLRRTN